MRLDTVKYAYSVEFMCWILGVSKSGYYDWRGHPESATKQRREELKTLIRQAFDEADATYGHRRIHAELQRAGVRVGVELVRHLMRDLQLVPCQPQPRRAGAQMASVLLDDAMGPYVTGVNLPVDGGLSLHNWLMDV